MIFQSGARTSKGLWNLEKSTNIAKIWQKNDENLCSTCLQKIHFVGMISHITRNSIFGYQNRICHCIIWILTNLFLFIFTIGFVKIWALFQNNAQDIIDELVPDPEHILWTSTLTSAEYISNVPKDYTIQIWTDASVSLNLCIYL